ncbi:MAG: hydroxyisourate hydrolase [Acidobacteria bacterium]|nr:hydroxyisourate hydrolase [Acidobacteriota bacterium]MBV9477170.1 hydroxyisourate hydrolase [Acidobacteriota bacterium]
MAGITTHVLDTAQGRPAAGMRVTLHRGDELLFEGTTNADGRARVLPPEATQPGTYRITFDTGAYNANGFFPEASIVFRIDDATQHHHVPLLLSPFGYATYRGS